MIEVGAAEAGAREKTKIAAQGARYGPQIGRASSLAPLADNIADPGSIITKGRRTELRQQLMQETKMAGYCPVR